MKQPTIPPRLAGKIAKYHPLSEPIRLQDLEDFCSLASLQKKKKYVMFFFLLSSYSQINIIIIIIIIIIILFHLFIY